MGKDLLVNLYDIDFNNIGCPAGFEVRRVLSPNADLTLKFIEENFSSQWASEVKAAVYQNNPTCFIAVKNNEIVGFGAYNATCKGFFGPTGVKESERKQGIGKIILMKSLAAMKEEGYAYAVIGGASSKALHFYMESCKAIQINNNGTIYERLIK